MIEDPTSGVRAATAIAEISHPPAIPIEILAGAGATIRQFGATVDLGVADPRADVVILHCDTIVTQGWLDALLRCAASDARVATVTPFSNDMGVDSLTKSRVFELWPAGVAAEPFRAALERTAVPSYPDLPVGGGSCILIRRQAIEAIGAFDAGFSTVWGSECDFSARAAFAGWRNALADDAVVVRAVRPGPVGSGRDVTDHDREILHQRYPHLTNTVEHYVAEDPLRPLWEAGNSQLRLAQPTVGVLHVIHDHGGGTETQVRTLIDASRRRWRHYLVIAVGNRWQFEEHCSDGAVVTYTFSREDGESWREFVAGLCATFRIGVIHLHNISGCRGGLLEALQDAPVPFGYTLHDLNFACPTITLLDASGRYCGGQTDVAICQRCLDAQPAFEATEIATWRSSHARLINAASFVIGPSAWAAGMLGRYFGRDDIQIIPHGTPANETTRAPGLRRCVLIPNDNVPVVVALGAIGPDKGARRIEHLARLIARRQARLRLVVIGYLDVEHGPWQSDDAILTVHGRYDRRDLPDLLAHYRARFVLYPSAGPETFSYTLSEAWRAGYPALVPPIGALAERMQHTGAGWILTEDEWDDDERMLDRMLALIGATAADPCQAKALRARGLEHTTAVEMAEATLACYDAALAASTRKNDATEFTRTRVRDALGYRRWSPPIAPAPTEPAPVVGSEGNLTQIGKVMLAIRRTPIGGVLLRIMPGPVVDALKARLLR
ncbi:MAG: glycosyltransferase [Betaproteobacteria bacterium]